MEFITVVEAQLVAAAQAAITAYAGNSEAPSLEAMEQAVQELAQTVGRTVLAGWLERQAGKYPPDTVACACGSQARYERRRDAVTLTLQGRVQYRRPYYRCRCGRGCCPLDERLGIRPGQMSDRLQQVATALGVSDAFGSSADRLAQLTGVRLSPNSLRAACQQTGEQVVAHEQALLARSQDLSQQRGERRTGPHPQRLYGSLDGFHAPFVDGWHEVKAGCWWTVAEHNQTLWRQYYADTVSAEAFADLVWARGFEVGAPQADELIFIADGAVWIWNIVGRHFPQAVQIVDFYHAASYLAHVARDAFGDTTPEARQWTQTYSQHLLEGRLATVVRACRPLAARAPQAVAAARHYFAVNRTRLRYAKYRALGYQIGSGMMESGCKQLGTERLKIAGARWTPTGGRLLVKARAAVLSGDWPQGNAARLTVPQVA
jgi:hypothetical protein